MYTAVWRLEDNLWGSILSLYLWAQGIDLSSLDLAASTVLFFVFLFLDSISLCSFEASPGTHSIGRAVLELIHSDMPASASPPKSGD